MAYAKSRALTGTGLLVVDLDKYRRDVEEAVAFIEWLETHAFEEIHVEWPHFSFRIVFDDFDPLSIEGSLSCGGRFNIGGAQICPDFPNHPMQGMLYAASTRRCAYREAGDPPLGPHELFTLYPQKTLSLWDLASMLKPYPDLKAIIDSTPFDAVWGYQKVPKVSQILGAYLRQKGGDGIIYPSVKDLEGDALAFFAKDHAHMLRSFTAVKSRPKL